MHTSAGESLENRATESYSRLGAFLLFLLFDVQPVEPFLSKRSLLFLLRSSDTCFLYSRSARHILNSNIPFAFLCAVSQLVAPMNGRHRKPTVPVGGRDFLAVEG